jgi:hypothetical protein
MKLKELVNLLSAIGNTEEGSDLKVLVEDRYHDPREVDGVIVKVNAGELLIRIARE